MKNKKNILKYILVCISIFIVIIVIEFCCLYAATRDKIWIYLKDFWEWYKTFFF